MRQEVPDPVSPRRLGFSSDPRLRVFQIEQLFRAMPLAVAATLVNSLIIVAGLRGHVGNLALAVWFGANAVLVALFVAGLWWSRRPQYREQGYPGAETAIYAYIIAVAMLWGSTSQWLFVHNNEHMQLFLVFVLGGMAAGSVVTLSQLFYPALLYTLMTLAPLVLHLFSDGGSFTGAMGGLLLVFMVVLLSMAWINYRSICDGILGRLAASDRGRQAREELSRLMQQREQFFGLCQDMMCVANFQGYFLDLNPRWCELLGYSEEELKAVPFLTLIHPDDVEGTRREIASLAGEGYRTINYVNRFRDRNGRWHWIRWNAGARPDLNLIFAAAHDISDLKEQQALLQQHKRRLEQEVLDRTRSLWESEQRLRYLLRESPAVIYTCEAQGNYPATYVSPNVRDLFGYSPEEFIRTPDFWLSNIHADDRERILAELDGLTSHGWIRNEYRFRLASGEYCWVRDELRVVEDEQGKPHELIGYMININDIRTSEQALQETNNRFRVVVENAPEAFILLDNRGVIQDVNGNACRLLGYDAEDLRGTNLFTGGMLVDERQMRDSWADVLEGNPQRMDIRLRCKGGATLPVEVHMGIYTAGDEQKVIVLARDISERLVREQELRSARDVALQASAAKTDFLSRMSHELRTPMNAILGFAQLLQMDSGMSRDQHESVGEILRAGDHLLELINEVLDLSRIEADRINLSRDSLAVVPLLEDCVSLIRTMADHREIKLELDKEAVSDVYFNADATRIRQVLINLLTNAVKYNQPGGRVELSARFEANRLLRIQVQDSGIGIPADQQSKLFQPFHRLGGDDQSIEGTGIGLVIARKLTELMGGSLEFESAEGRGSTFWVEFPAWRENVRKLDFGERKTARREIAMSESSGSGDGTWHLLYVEDNMANRRLVERIFESKPDISLECRGSAEDGLSFAQSRRPDLILLDINLPGMDGYEVLKRLRENDETRDITVIAISANAMDSDIEKGMNAGFDEYITKPIDIQRLLTSVYASLQARTGNLRGA